MLNAFIYVNSKNTNNYGGASRRISRLSKVFPSSFVQDRRCRLQRSRNSRHSCMSQLTLRAMLGIVEIVSASASQLKVTQDDDPSVLLGTEASVYRVGE
jgi:hypothetical protein